MADIDVERQASEEREHKLALSAIAAAKEVCIETLRLIGEHAKSPAVAAQLMEAANGHK